MIMGRAKRIIHEYFISYGLVSSGSHDAHRDELHEALPVPVLVSVSVPYPLVIRRSRMYSVEATTLKDMGLVRNITKTNY